MVYITGETVSLYCYFALTYECMNLKVYHLILSHAFGRFRDILQC